MTLRMPGVPYLGPPDSNWSDTEIRPPLGQVTHIAQGSFEGTCTWQRNPASRVSSYFVVARDGRIAQMLDLDRMAWTQSDGNPRWVGVENEGFNTQAFTEVQIDANAAIFAWLRSVYPSIPAQVSNSPGVGGLGWHGMGGVAWGNHPDCPGAVNVALLPTILARATGAQIGRKAMSYILQAGPSQYVVPGGLAASGKPGAIAMYGAIMSAHRAALPTVNLPAGVTAEQAGYEVNPPAWPVCPDCDCGNGGGGSGPSLEQIRAALRAELDETSLMSIPGVFGTQA